MYWLRSKLCDVKLQVIFIIILSVLDVLFGTTMSLRTKHINRDIISKLVTLRLMLALSMRVVPVSKPYLDGKGQSGLFPHKL